MVLYYSFYINIDRNDDLMIDFSRIRCPSSVYRKTPPEEESSNGMRLELCLGLSGPFLF